MVSEEFLYTPFRYDINSFILSFQLFLNEFRAYTRFGCRSTGIAALNLAWSIRSFNVFLFCEPTISL